MEGLLPEGIQGRALRQLQLGTPPAAALCVHRFRGAPPPPLETVSNAFPVMLELLIRMLQQRQRVQIPGSFAIACCAALH